MRRPSLAVPLVVLLLLVGAGVLMPAGSLRAEPSVAGVPDFSSVVERVEAGVVHIHTYLGRSRDVPDSDDRGPADEFLGSGFIYSPDGWILTNRHVADGAKEILVQVKGRGWFVAAMRGIDAVADVALLKIEAQGLTALPLGNPRELKVGQAVLAAGSPYHLPRSFSAGIVSGLGRCDVVNPTGYEDYIQTDAAINLGSSGGPLIDGAGKVVGLNTAILSRSGGNQGIAFAVPIDVVAWTADQLRSRGTVVRPTLGVVVRPLTPREALQVPGGEGLRVTKFAEESPARRAGVQEGDTILRANGIPTAGRGTLMRVTWSKPAGTPITLDVLRGGNVVTLTARAIER